MIKFDAFDLMPEIQQALATIGFENPTPIQAETIPFLLDQEKDLVANAQTGTGKTAAFGIPLIQKTDLSNSSTQALILSPTRELAIQIKKDLDSYAQKIRGFRTVAVYGGASAENQISDLRRGAHIVVGTPGRTLDLINRKKLKVDKIQYLVLDEADEMLNMGFKDELDKILETTPSKRHTLLFSATMPRPVLQIAKNYMGDYEEITVGQKNVGAVNVEHFYYMVQARNKYLALKRIVDMAPSIYGIVFCRTRREAKDIAEKLIKDGYNSDALHGDLSQSQRDHVMNRFRMQSIQLLIATDVAARGLDVNDLTHVINFNLPDDPEVYVHRSGRTGRAGKKGISVSIIHSREKRKIREMEKMVKKSIKYKPVPNGNEICEKQLYNLVSKMENTEVDESKIESFMPVIYEKLSWLSKEDIIKKFVSTEFNRFLDYYKNAQDLNIGEEDQDRGGRYQSEGRGRRDRDRRRDDRGRGDRDSSDRPSRREMRKQVSRNAQSGDFSRVFISLGSKDSVKPKELIGIVNDNNPKLSVEIGKIEILKSFSFFEVESQYKETVIKSLNGKFFKDRKIVAEHADSKGKKENTRFKKEKRRPKRR